MTDQKVPPGWHENRVKDLIKHYENISEDELIAEDEVGKWQDGETKGQNDKL